MINSVVLGLEDLGFEQLGITGQCTIGDITSVNVFLKHDELTLSQQEVYDAMIGLIGSVSISSIDNTVCAFGIDRITSDPITEQSINLDYNIMSAEDKLIVDNFCALVEELNTI